MPLPAIHLFNTLSRKVELFTPLVPGEAAIYCCGPTVYNYPHIGNMRAYIFEDLLVRTLRHAGYRVKHVMNITDVGHLQSDADEGEDKMLVAARREGKRSRDIADFYTNVFFEHCAKLNICKPDVVCRATDHIAQMIELIKRLEERGLAYQSGGNVYFDVERFPSYGALALLNKEQLRAGARIEVDAEKRNPLDFALWFTRSKFADQEMKWESPWGEGYPGWHIECSAMAQAYLGETLDIHCGGIDHIPVHHTNEIAQSEGATGKPFARFWLHGGFLVTGKDKMAKSSGEFLTLDRLIERGFDPISYRLFCMSASYRGELSWSWQALEAAANTLKKIKSSVVSWKSEAKDLSATVLNERACGLKQSFEAEIFNDLNFPNALRVFHQVLNDSELEPRQRLRLVLDLDHVLGLGAASWEQTREEVPAEVNQLALERQAARAAKDWKRADALRERIAALGFNVEDRPDGFNLTRR